MIQLKRARFEIKQRVFNYSLYIIMGFEVPSWGGSGAYLLTFIYFLDKPFGNNIFIFFNTFGSLGLIKTITSLVPCALFPGRMHLSYELKMRLLLSLKCPT